ncbi:MAG: RecQ family ATP-dependent DNA helicase [Oscillospiraceae bacterium]|nr:RecQ family ATP-dependent DNA helicase [Oscillospiraceae bacterium]
MEKQKVLSRYFGYDAFRPGQEALIDAVLAGRDALGVMPTGAGKSLCYQIPALMLTGITLVISPLISLMQDQVTALVQAGVPAAYLNSSLSPAQFREALRRLEAGRYKLVYVAPERLALPGFQELCAKLPITFVAVDEAHCISQWGQDFRPDYLRIPAFLAALPTRPVLGAYTATATAQVKGDIIAALDLRDPVMAATGFDRPNLFFAVRKPKSKNRALLQEIEKHPNQSGIVYCATRKKVEAVCELLRSEGYAAGMYHAGMEKEARTQAQEDFLHDRVQIMAATNAFGMGIDKSNVSFVIHYNMPASVEAYYQEAGRAGRDGEAADCVLLYSPGDVMTQRYLIEHSEPNPNLTEDEQEQVRQMDEQRLNQMRNYALDHGCLRSHLLRYFGEKRYDRCGHCSNCLGLPREDDEGTIKLAKKELRAKRNEDVEDPALFEALRQLRLSIAREQNLKPFMVFSDATLRSMCEVRPTTMGEFLAVSGVGETKAKRYGEAFLACIRECG